MATNKQESDPKPDGPVAVVEPEAVSTESISAAEPSSGWHPLHPLAEQDWAAVNLEYRPLKDDEKPDPSTVAELQILPSDKE